MKISSQANQVFVAPHALTLPTNLTLTSVISPCSTRMGGSASTTPLLPIPSIIRGSPLLAVSSNDNLDFYCSKHVWETHWLTHPVYSQHPPQTQFLNFTVSSNLQWCLQLHHQHIHYLCNTSTQRVIFLALACTCCSLQRLGLSREMHWLKCTNLGVELRNTLSNS